MAVEHEREVYTRTGKAYVFVTNTVSLLVTAWLMTDPFGWVPPMDYFSVRGGLFLAALLLAGTIAFGCLLLGFALLAIALKKLGIKLTQPAGG